MRKSTLPLLIAATLLFTQTALAWDATGHEAVAAIAWDNMKPETRTRAAAILHASMKGDCLHELGAGGDARAFFIRAATWADVVRPLNKEDVRECIQFHQPNWHFFDHFWSGVSGGTGSDAPQVRTDIPLATTNAVERLGFFQPLVACHVPPCEVTPFIRSHDLAWILHLVGDIHQPLHDAARVTTATGEERGDQGGNLFKFQMNMNPSNLHSLWDRSISNTIVRQQGEQEIHYIDRVIAKIQHDHPKASLMSRLESGQFDTWSKEGFAFAQDVAYPATLPRGGVASEAYKSAVFNVTEEEVALAGYRLADLLDQMFE